MRSRTYRASWLAPLLVLGCSQPPDLTVDIDEHANRINDSLALICDCHQDAGFSSRAECSDMLGFVGLDERQCITDALEGSEEEGKDYLACANAAYDGYITCLDANSLANCEDGGIAVCDQALDQALAACTQVPTAVQDSISACTS